MLTDKKKEAKLIVSDVFSWVFMICGSLMAIANGLIPSLAAMIYGKLVDELVIHYNVGCILNESVTTIKLENITEFTVIYPRMKGIITNDTTAINVLLNGSHVRVEVIGLTGIQMKEINVTPNGSSIILNATSFDGAGFEGVKVMGTRVEMVALQETNARGGKLKGDNKGVKKTQAKGTKNGTTNYNTEGNKTKLIKSRMKAEEREKNEKDRTTIENGKREKNASMEPMSKNNNKTSGKGKGGSNTTSVKKEQISKETEKYKIAKESKDSNKIDNNHAFEKEKTINEREARHSDSKYKPANTEEKLSMKSTYHGNIRRQELYFDSNKEITLSNKDKSGYSGTNPAFTTTLKYLPSRFLIKAIARDDFNTTQGSLTMETEPKNGTSTSKKPRKATVTKSLNRTEIETRENVSRMINVSNSNGTESTTSNGSSVIVTKVDSKKNSSHREVIRPKTRNIVYTVRNITENCKATERRMEVSMMKYALYYVYAAVGILMFAYGQMVFWNIASERGVRNLSENLTQSAMKKEPGYYDTKTYEGAVNFETLSDHPLEWINQGELDALNGGVGGEIAYLIQSVSNVMSGFIVSFIENWKITLVMMVAAPILAIVQGIAYKVEALVTARKDELMRPAGSMAEKSLRSMKTVVSFAGEKIEKTRFSKKLEATKNLIEIRSIILGAQTGVTTVVMFGFLGLGFWYSSSLLLERSVAPGTLMTIFMAIISGVMQLSGAGRQMEDVRQAKTALMSLLGISQQEEDQDSFDKTVKQLENVLGKLDVFNVSFHYPCQPDYQILKSVNFTIEKGQTIALLGDKECGKSSLIKLLQRIFDPQAGKVRLDGHDLRCLDRQWFRRQVGIVHRKPEFFNTSIAENISYGKEGCTLKQIVQAARDAGAHEFIENLPRRYATVLSDNGLPLTPYQKHLLALARALIRNPRILLWEENQAIMDNESLNALTSYLDKAGELSHGPCSVRAAVTKPWDESLVKFCAVLHQSSRLGIRRHIHREAHHTFKFSISFSLVVYLVTEFISWSGFWSFGCKLHSWSQWFVLNNETARRGQTTVISTSHVSFARIADVVFVLHEGKIIEEGSPDELLQSGGAFSYLTTLQYFESQTLHRENLLKVVPSTIPPVVKWVEALESTFAEKQEQTEDQVKSFTTRINEMLEDKLSMGKAAYEMIAMQLQDLPLLLSGALGAAVTGMVAPGLAFLFNEIQKVLNDPVRIAQEGTFWASMFILLGVVVGFGGMIEKFMLSYASEKLRVRLQEMAFDSAISKTGPNPQKQAELMMNQIEKDVEATLQNSIGRYLGAHVQETISSVLTLAMALYNGWKMTLVVLAGIPIIGLANRLQQNETEASVEPQGVGALMSTSFKKMETITALGLESQFAKKYKDAITEKYKYALKKIITSGFAFALGQAMVFIIYAVALRFGCYLISRGDMTAIQVLGVLMTVLFGSQATASSRAPSHSSAHAKESLDRLFEDETTNTKDQTGDKLERVEGKLDFQHVELPDPFGKSPPLLRQLNIKVSGRQTIAFVPLNNEKVNPVEVLVERFYDPVGGRLLLDETDIRSLDLGWLRDQQAVVSHRLFMPHRSIAENIAYGDNKRKVTRREIEEAAHFVFAHEFIMALPKGYDTIPEEDVITLTNSQKQKISIARALIRAPSILIVEDLEEVDQAVNDATQILARNKTCLIMTRHRAIIEAADQILLVYRGHVLEQGNLKELLDLRRFFYFIWTSLHSG